LHPIGRKDLYPRPRERLSKKKKGEKREAREKPAKGGKERTDHWL